MRSLPKTVRLMPNVELWIRVDYLYTVMKPMLQDKLQFIDWRDDLAVVAWVSVVANVQICVPMCRACSGMGDYRKRRACITRASAYTCGRCCTGCMGAPGAHRPADIVDVNSIIATLGTSGNPGNLRGVHTRRAQQSDAVRRDAYCACIAARGLPTACCRVITDAFQPRRT